MQLSRCWPALFPNTFKKFHGVYIRKNYFSELLLMTKLITSLSQLKVVLKVVLLFCLKFDIHTLYTKRDTNIRSCTSTSAEKRPWTRYFINGRENPASAGTLACRVLERRIRISPRRRLPKTPPSPKRGSQRAFRDAGDQRPCVSSPVALSSITICAGSLNTSWPFLPQ